MKPRLSGMILQAARSYPGLSLAVVLTIVFDTAFESLIPLIFALLIDTAVLPGKTELFWGPALLMAAGWLLSASGQLVRDLTHARLTARLLDLHRRQLEQRVNRAGGQTSAADLPAPAELSSLFSRDLAHLENFWLNTLPLLLFSLLYIGLGLAAMFTAHPGLAAGVLLSLPLVILGPVLLKRGVDGRGQTAREAETRLAARLLDTVEARPLLRLFGTADRFRAGFVQQAEGLQTAQTSFFSRSNLYRRLPNLTIHFLQLALWLAGAWLVLQGDLGLGQLIAFNLLFANVLTGILDFTLTLGPMVQARAAWANLQSVTHPDVAPAGQTISGSPAAPSPAPRTKPAHSAYPGTALPPSGPELPPPGPPLPGPSTILPEDRWKQPPPAPAAGELLLALEQAAWQAPDGRPVLHGINLELRRGQTSGLVGASGSGKSSLLNLLAGLTSPSTGNRSLRPGLRLAAVFQDNPVLDASLRDNLQISLGAPAADSALHEVLALVDLDDWTRALPAGLDTRLGGRHLQLSAGQRQRLGLARALLAQPDVLLLDEATSALDPQSEARIRATLHSLAPHIALFEISRDLDRLQSADHLHVLEGGTLTASGRHEDLLARGGLYHQLWIRRRGLTPTAGDQTSGVPGITPEALATIPLFAGSSPATLAALAAHFVSESVPAGRLLIRQGTPGSHFWIIVRGRVSIVLNTPDKGPRKAASLGDGDFFGEMSLLDGNLTSADVTADQPTSLLCLEKTAFHRLTQSEPQLLERLQAAAAARRQANQK